MSTMEKILRLMAEKKASDVYLSARAPALIKINGECVPINAQLLPPEAPLALLAEVASPEAIEELKAAGRTIVLVTHDPAVASLARRRVHLRDGKVERDETRP